LVAAVPPLALVLSFELLMRQVRAAVEPKVVRAVVPAAVPADGERVIEAPVLARARRLVHDHRAAGRRVTSAGLARELGVSDGYARRLLRQLSAEAGGVAR